MSSRPGPAATRARCGGAVSGRDDLRLPVALALVYIFPFVIAIATSFKTEPDATADPLALVPTR